MSQPEDIDEYPVLAMARTQIQIGNLYAHARLAMEFVKQYLREGDEITSPRVRDSLGSVRHYRACIAKLRGQVSW